MKQRGYKADIIIDEYPPLPEKCWCSSWELFHHMYQEHGIALTETQLYDLELAVKEMQERLLHEKLTSQAWRVFLKPLCVIFGCKGSWNEACRRCGEYVPPMY